MQAHGHHQPRLAHGCENSFDAARHDRRTAGRQRRRDQTTLLQRIQQAGILMLMKREPAHRGLQLFRQIIESREEHGPA